MRVRATISFLKGPLIINEHQLTRLPRLPNGIISVLRAWIDTHFQLQEALN